VINFKRNKSGGIAETRQGNSVFLPDLISPPDSKDLRIDQPLQSEVLFLKPKALSSEKPKEGHNIYDEVKIIQYQPNKLEVMKQSPKKPSSPGIP
jgi:hypothetical protein